MIIQNWAKSSNTKRLFALGLAGIFLTVVIKSYISKPHISVNVVDNKSPLLSIIDCNEFVKSFKNWEWDGIQISQGNDTNGDEYALCRIIGHVDNQSQTNYLMFFYKITRPTTSVINQSMVSKVEFVASENFYPNFVTVGENSLTNCVSNQDEYSCTIAIQYDKAILLMRYSGDGKRNNASMEDMVNTTLIRLDKYIQDTNN